MAPHLRAADADIELLEQLRTVSVSREADPPDDSQRAGGKGTARVRPRRKYPRLAIRRRPRERAADDPRVGNAGGDVLRRWPQRTSKYRRRAHDLPDRGRHRP